MNLVRVIMPNYVLHLDPAEMQFRSAACMQRQCLEGGKGLRPTVARVKAKAYICLYSTQVFELRIDIVEGEPVQR